MYYDVRFSVIINWNASERNIRITFKSIFPHFWQRKIRFRLTQFWFIELKCLHFIWKSKRKLNWIQKSKLNWMNLKWFLIVRWQKSHIHIQNSIQKQTSRGVPRKSCSENMQQIYRKTPNAKCDFNNVAKELYWNHTSA